MRSTIRAAAGAALGLLLLSCAGLSGPSTGEIERDISEGRIDEAAGKLERAREAQPNNAQTRIDLARVYYRKARTALDEDREDDYARFIAQAHDELIAAAEIRPDSASVHLWMGIILAYQGQIDSALASFRNAQKLEPRVWVHTTNLAEIWIYKGNIARSRSLLDRARKMGASRAVIELNEVLAAWRTGDYVEARDMFDGLYAMNPDIVRTWNEAPVDDPIESFEEFTAFCCGHLACGPYMENACKDMELEVAKRELEADTLRREMEHERDRRRRLKEIYDRHRELDIEVEEP